MTFLNLKKILSDDKVIMPVGMLVLGIIIGLGIYFLAFLGKIYPNIYVNDIYLGKLNRDKALTVLKEKVVQDRYLNFFYENETYIIDPKDFDVQVNLETTVEKALEIGRSKDFIDDFRKQIELLGEKNTLNLDIEYDNEKLDGKIASISAAVNETAIYSEVFLVEKYDGTKEATISGSKPGKILEKEVLKQEILNAYQTGDFENKDLPVKIESKTITREDEIYIKSLANSLLGKKLKLKLEDMNWEVGDEEMVNFLSVYDVFDNGKLVSWVNELAKNIDREPEDALFEFDGKMVTEFRPAKKGLKLIRGEALKDMRDGIKTLAGADGEEHELGLKVYEEEPKIQTGEANDLGIKELIGKGESWFGHSIGTRVHNVNLASTKMHGVLVAPGEEFSLLKYVAPIDKDHGYQSAYIIQNGRTILGDGGGVCQTSTTMFRAALNAGLPILERHPHAYRVDYYEQNYDVGVDASVFEPSADFRFLNDTPTYILIQTFVDTENLYAHYDLYGTSDGRQASVGKATIWSQSPPPPDVYQDDPTLPVGVVNQVDWRAWGAKVSFDWKVTRNGEVLREETFWSTYRPWAAVYLRGTRQ